MSDDLIRRQDAIDALARIAREKLNLSNEYNQYLAGLTDGENAIWRLPSAEPDVPDTNVGDMISRQAAIEWLTTEWDGMVTSVFDGIKRLPSAQPEQRYTEEELRVFAHGISLSLLSKRSAQHWRYDKDTATEIELLERLYDKVSADMKGRQG